MTDRVVDGVLQLLVYTGGATLLGAIGVGVFWLWLRPKLLAIAFGAGIGIALVVMMYQRQPELVSTVVLASSFLAGALLVLIYVANRPPLAMIVIARLAVACGLSFVGR